MRINFSNKIAGCFRYNNNLDIQNALSIIKAKKPPRRLLIKQFNIKYKEEFPSETNNIRVLLSMPTSTVKRNIARCVNSGKNWMCDNSLDIADKLKWQDEDNLYVELRDKNIRRLQKLNEFEAD